MKYINLGKLLLLIVCSISGFFVAYFLQKKRNAGKESHYMDKIGKVNETIYKDESRYEKKRRYLKAVGADYMLKRQVEPAEYLLLQAFLAMFCGIAGWCSYGILAGLICMVAGVSLPGILLKVSNNRDNQLIMEDIKTIYDTLIIKMEGGVFFTSALAECYRLVKNKRLKSALLILNSSISATSDIESAFGDFNARFSNQYIDSLSLIIKQSLESGFSVQSLNDISNQMNHMQEALYMKKQNELDKKILFIQMLVYAGIIGVCCYVSIAMSGNNILGIV